MTDTSWRILPSDWSVFAVSSGPTSKFGEAPRYHTWRHTSEDC
jgi:hypothetical protein